MLLGLEELSNLIAGGVTPNQVAELKPSDAVRNRVAYLLSRLKSDDITSEESAELDDYLWLEHFMMITKARARQHIRDESNGS